MENKAAQMDKVYNPQAIEGELYKEWEETGAFVAHREEGKKPFTIVMPPPNITGQLHMGHAMDGVLQDSLTRYHRMKGDPTLWLPGTDHASIATEVKIVEAMRKEGLDKHDVGREEFLRLVLICLLKMLHPFMPFITDEVYRYIPGTEGTIMLSDWPKVDDAMDFPQEAREMEGVMDVIRAVRNLRAEMNVSVGRRAHLIVRPKAGWEHAMEGAGEYFGRLAWASGMQILGQDEEAPAKTVSAVSEAAELFIPLGDLVDVAKETARLTKERDSVQRDIERGEAKLNNPGFMSKAPAQLVEQEREKLAVSRDKLEKLNARIEDLKNM